MPAAAALPLITAGIGAGGSIAGAAISANAAGKVNSTGIPPPNPLFPQAQTNFLQQMGVLGQPGGFQAGKYVPGTPGTGLGPSSLGALNTLAQTGSPTDVGPAWQALVDSQQRTASQGRANIKEQFAGSGLAYSSPLMDKLVDYEGQLGKDYGSILANYTFQAQESAKGRQLAASQFGADLFSQAGLAMTPSSIQTVGGASPVGSALSGGGSALQMLAFMKMLYPGANPTGGSSGVQNVPGSISTGDAGATIPPWAQMNPVFNVGGFA